MTASYPTERRSFNDNEAISGSAALAGMPRALMEWQNYTYNSDLPISPCDAVIYGASEFLPWQADGASNSSPSPQRTASSSVVSRVLSEVTLPPPRIPVAGVKVWAWVELAATDSVGEIRVYNLRNRVAYSSTVTYAACGSVLTGAWIGIDAEAQPWDQLFITAAWTSGGSLTVAGLSGYWKAATLWNSGAQAFISQAHPTADRPLSSTVPRWLMQSANRFQQERAPLQFLSAYLEKWACGNLTDWVSSRVVLGAYKVLVGEKVTSLKVSIYAKSSGSTTVLVKFDGVTKHTFTVNSGTYSWQDVSISVTGGSTAAPISVTLQWGAEAATAVYVPSVSIWEESATLSLPGSETVPAAFVPNDNDDVVGRSPITSAQWARLVANMVWIWKYRGLRSLVCDSRWTASMTTADRHAPDGGDYAVQGVWRFRFADGPGVPRFLPHWHGWYANWLPDSPDYPLTWSWLDDSAHKADAATATRVQFTYGDTGDGSTPLSAGLIAACDTTEAKISPPWVTSSAQVEDYRAWQTFDGGSTSLSGTRVCGVVIEQAPLNATAGTRY
jgi:hypothetical protein